MDVENKSKTIIKNILLMNIAVCILLFAGCNIQLYGYDINKVGVTTYKTSALVQSANFDFTVGGITFTNLTKTDYFAEEGYSGGLVYMYYDSKFIPAGLIKGGTNNYTVYTKASEVVSSLGIYPY